MRSVYAPHFEKLRRIAAITSDITSGIARQRGPVRELIMTYLCKDFQPKNIIFTGDFMNGTYKEQKGVL